MFAVTLPMAENSVPNAVIRTETSVPLGKTFFVLTKQPPRLKSRVSATNCRVVPNTNTSAMPPKLTRSEARRSCIIENSPSRELLPPSDPICSSIGTAAATAALTPANVTAGCIRPSRIASVKCLKQPIREFQVGSLTSAWQGIPCCRSEVPTLVNSSDFLPVCWEFTGFDVYTAGLSSLQSRNATLISCERKTTCSTEQKFSRSWKWNCFAARRQ